VGWTWPSGVLETAKSFLIWLLLHKVSKL
jgi:hypothetical protein